MRFKVLIVLLFISFIKANSQDRIDSAMTTLFEKYPQEKVYLAYDRTDYVIGKTI